MLLLLDDDILHTWTGDVFHDQHRLAFFRQAVLIGFDDFGMLHLHRDFAFGRLVQSLESSFEEFDLFDVKDFHADDAIVVQQVFGDEEMRHRSRRSRPFANET